MALDYLPSPSWAVIYGETPSATRWSELGDNDDALATGAGIDDFAIIARHLGYGAVLPKAITTKTYQMSGSDITLTTSYQNVMTTTIQASDMPGTGNYFAQLEAALNCNFGGNGTVPNDVYFKVYVDGVQTNVIGDTFTSGKPAATTYNTMVPISSKLRLAAGSAHTIDIKATLTNSMSGVISYAGSRSNALITLLGKE